MPYSRPPITEAVIDVRAAFETPPTLSSLRMFADRLRGQLPLVQDINSFAVNFAAEGAGPIETSTASEQLGYRLSNERNDRILQIGPQSLAYSHLPPYTNWEQFKGEFSSIWDDYCHMFGTKLVSRIALRYINRISVPAGQEIEDFLNIGPRIPEGISRTFIGYFAQMVFPMPDLGREYRAIINTGVEPARAPEQPNLLLDIDLFGERHFRIDEVWMTLEELRTRKNRFFEAAISDRVRDLIR